jgi:glycosyltransferase involved in cell wall biosynthesis
MKHFYISSYKSSSGISRYANDFYRLVLQERDYIHLDSSLHYSEIFSAVSSRDHVHIEIGIFQKKEIEILMRMIRARYRHITVTLHDAPLIKYPFYDFKLPVLNKVSKFYDLHWDNFSAITPYMRKIERIYVLSKKGTAVVRKKYHINHVHYLPHVIDVNEVRRNETINNHLIFFGFIGPNKGIEYSLRLHQELLKRTGVDTQFYVVGTAIGRQKAYYEQLKSKFTQNVHYLGYVEEDELNHIFDQATIALLPFKDYQFFYPASGSVLRSISKGKLVVTNKVNTVPEIIKDGETGVYLSGNVYKDAETLTYITERKYLISSIIEEAQNFILKNHSAAKVTELFLD